MQITPSIYRKLFLDYIRNGRRIELGFKQISDSGTYIWRSLHDGKTRTSHLENDGIVFSWDDPPPTGHPGEDYNCRCVAEPSNLLPHHEQFFRERILAHEGGYVNDPSDRGGATNMGVTFRTWQHVSMRLFGLDATIQSLMSLTEDQAFRIYEEEYWRKSGASQIINPHLANMHADFAYNAGPGNAGTVLQKTINELGSSVAVDGSVGPQTLAALSKLDQVDVYTMYRRLRIQYYEEIVEGNPSQARFINGWRNRANSFDDY